MAFRLPRRTSHERIEHRYLTHDEFSHLLGCVHTHYRPLLMTLAVTGMRWGEAEALTVADVDLAGATTRINKAAKWQAIRPADRSGRPRPNGLAVP